MESTRAAKEKKDIEKKNTKTKLEKLFKTQKLFYFSCTIDNNFSIVLWVFVNWIANELDGAA